MTENTSTAVRTERPVRVVNEQVLMFVRITQVLNKRDDLNEKIKHDFFFNDLDSAKAKSRDLANEQGVGYLWMTKALDTLNADGTVDRVNENFMWTRRSQWQRKETKAYTISAEDVAKAEARRNGTDTVSNLPAADNDADF